MEFEEICQNCDHFIQDNDDLHNGLGICIMDEVFEPFLDEILENADFSSCRNDYIKKRFKGCTKACDQYERTEYPEDSGGSDNDFDADIYIDSIRRANVDGIIEYLYNSNLDIVGRAISAISKYILLGNESATAILLKFYTDMGPAETLDDVHLRIRIIKLLSSVNTGRYFVEAYINELARTPSNNTTRQLYTAIIEALNEYPLEIIEEPILELLGKRKYGIKIKDRIMGIINDKEMMQKQELWRSDPWW